MLGFGFALFLMMVVLAFIYSQFTMRQQESSVDTTLRSPVGGMQKGMLPSTAPLPTAVNPSTAAEDIIDEALTDRDDLSVFTEDELADIEEGN